MIIKTNDAGLNKERESFTIKKKCEIIKRLQRGEKQSEINKCCDMKLNKSTVATIGTL